VRPPSAPLLALLAGAEIGVRFFVRITLEDGVWAGSDAPDTFTFDDVEYQGFDLAFAVEPPGLSRATRPTGGSVSLSGTDEAVLAGVFALDYRARPIETGLLFVDPDTGAYAEEWLLEKGRISHVDEKIAAGSAADPTKLRVSTVTAQISPISDLLARPGTRRRTDADQREYRDPLDGFLKDVGLVGTRTVNFGTEGANTPSAANPAGDQG